MTAPALSTTVASGTSWPLLAHLYSNAWRGNASNNSAAFKRSLGALVEPLPRLKFSLNSTGHPITLTLGSAVTGSGGTLPANGDIVVLTEQGGDGNVVWAGTVENMPDDYAETVKHELSLEYIGLDLDNGFFRSTYSSATDLGQMMRDAVANCTHVWADITSIPNTGITHIFDFSGGDYTPYKAADEILRMAGSTYYFFIDPTGRVWFGNSNMAGAATYSLVRGRDYVKRTQSTATKDLRNYVIVVGGIPAGSASPLAATYDNGTLTTGWPPPAPTHAQSSQYGVRALSPTLKYPKVLDQGTLNAIANMVGSSLNRVQLQYGLVLDNYGQRISLATATGAIARFIEPSSSMAEAESETGGGTYSANLTIVDLEFDGPTQTIVLSDMPETASDLDTLIQRMIDDALWASINSVQSTSGGSGGQITPGQVIGALTGPNTPTIPAFFPQGNTPPGFASGIDRVAQADNAYITVSWASNPANENVTTYQIRYQKTGDASWSDPMAVPGTTSGGIALSWKLPGLIPGQAYNFQIQAVNNLAIPSGWSGTSSFTAATDQAAPATPTGLTAIRTPRGALVSWSSNTEADLQGYVLQVSLDSGSTWSSVTLGTGGALATSASYLAPTGTPLGTILYFRLAAIDWSGNQSPWLTWPSSTQYHDAVLADSPQHWWRLNDAGPTTAADSGSPGGNNATKTGTLTWAQSGPTQDAGAAAVKFDGSTGYLADGNIYNAPAAFSVEAWIRSNGQQNTIQEIVRKGGNVWFLRVGDGVGGLAYFWVADNSANLYSVAGTTHVDDGAWHHVVGTWDGTTMRLYVDGTLQGTNNIGAHTLQTDANNLTIGATYSGIEYWNGWISEVALYNVALSAVRVQAHYVAGGAQTDGVIMDELRAGNVKVYGTLTTGGFQTAEGGQRFVVNSSAIQGFDPTSNNYGLAGGVGNTVWIGSNGVAQLAGNITASGISGSKIVVASNASPTYAGTAPADPSTGLALDPVNGFRVLKGGSVAMQADMSGNITINSGVGGGALTVNGGTITGATVIGGTIETQSGAGSSGIEGVVLQSGAATYAQISIYGNTHSPAITLFKWTGSAFANWLNVIGVSTLSTFGISSGTGYNLSLGAGANSPFGDPSGTKNPGLLLGLGKSLSGTFASSLFTAGHWAVAGTNNCYLNTTLYRNATGTDWTTTSYLLGFDVDSTGAAGGYISWSQGGQGVQTATPAYVWDVNGNCHAAGFPTSSDARLKRNIRPLGSVAALMAPISAVKFDWDPDALAKAGRSSYLDPNHPEDQEHFGFLAQDVISQFPEVVTFWTGQDGVEYHAVDYTRLIPVLWEAVKDLQAQVGALRPPT